MINYKNKESGHNKKKKFYKKSDLIIIFLFLAVLGFFSWNIFSQTEKKEQSKVETIEQEIKTDNEFCQNKNLLTNLCREREDSQLFFGVMIENHGEARPQSGLSKADVVFETIAESPITRFLAIFSGDNDLEKIGPVRSARPYYVEWIREFNIPYFHVGGSPDALDLIAQKINFDVNEFYNGTYFWRDNNKFAPHNVFTSTKLVEKVIEKKDWSFKNDFMGWSFYEDEQTADFSKFDSATKIKVDFLAVNYNVVWRYDSVVGNYWREQNNKPIIDAKGEEVRSRNIIVMYVNSRVIDDVGRRETETIGEGEAEIYYLGKKIVGRWNKKSLTDRTLFFDENGEEIKFVSGNFWIEVIPNNYPKVITE